MSVVRRLRGWAVLLVLLVAACARQPETGLAPVSGRSDVVARGRQAMVATADERASAAGLTMLKRGGNAIDAYAAASFAVGVVRPQSTGIGGGGFAVIHLRQDGQSPRQLAIDYRERAPAAARRDMFMDVALPEDASRFGALAVGTPGLVAGVLWVHERYGRLPRAEVMAPAIALAEDGFPVYPDLAKALDDMSGLLARHPESARVFLPGGVAPQAGAILRQPDLARTLRALAAGGRDTFYRGALPQAIVAEVQRRGGLLTTDDLAAYRVIERPVLRGQYRGFEIIAMPPPSSGGVLMIEMLNMLAAAGAGAGEATRVDRLHLLVEIMRRAYEDRAVYLGDPDFYSVPVDRLVSREFAAQRLSDFDPRRASLRPSTPKGNPATTSTTHLSIIDGEGNAVAATETINYAFGSGITVPGTGIVLNNEMDDFAARPGQPNLYGLIGGEANAIAPRKTPLSSMSPTIVARNGQPVLVVGSPGGSLIITATLQTILNIIDQQMPLPEAVAAPRIHHQAVPNQINYEPGAMDDAVAEELSRRGHVLQPVPKMGNVQAVMRLPSGEVVGVSDPRAEGRPAGF